MAARGATLGEITSSTPENSSTEVSNSDTGGPFNQSVVHKGSENRYLMVENQEIQVSVGEQRSQIDTSLLIVIFALNIP